MLWFAATAMAVAACVGLLAALLWGLSRVLQLLSPVLWPLAVAAVVACVLDPVVDAIERRGIPRTRAVLLTFLAGVALLTAFFGTIIPRLVEEAGQLASKVPIYSREIQDRATRWMAQPPRQIRWLFDRRELLLPTPTNPVPSMGATNLAAPPADTPLAESAESWQKRISDALASWATGFLPKFSSWLLDRLVGVTSLFGVFVGLALIPVYAFYLLKEKQGIQAKWRDYLPVQDSRFKDEVVFVLDAIQGYLVAFFRGQVLVATCDAVLYTIGFFIIGLNYAFLFGALAQMLTMIPFVGAIIICVSSIILAAVQFQDVLHPLLALGVFGVVQTVEGLAISPRIMGNRVGLHPLTILIAVMVGVTLLGGILGGILAIPLTATLRVLMFHYIWKKRSG